MHFERTSGLGHQFAEPGRLRDWAVDPVAIADEDVATAQRVAVMGMVVVVLYRHAPELEVFLVKHHNTAISGWWLPSNDMRPGKTFEEAVRRACGYYGFVPGEAGFSSVSFLSVVCSASARGGPCHLMGPVVGYRMTEDDQRFLRPGQTVDGEPSPRDFCAANKWVNPYTVLDNPAEYNSLLTGVLSDFVGAIDS